MADFNIIRTSEGGRVATFRYQRFPEIQNGETVSSVGSGPTATAPAGYVGSLPTFGLPTISSFDVNVPVFVTGCTPGTRFLLSCTALTNIGHPLTRQGYLLVEDRKP